MNDTIVVNQPRLTTDEDFIQQTAEDVQVEMSMLEGNHPKWHNDPVLDENVSIIINIIKQNQCITVIYCLHFFSSP